MNVPKAIETAVAQMVRKYAEVGADTVIRPFQNLNFDGSWDATVDREYPVVDIRFAPERTDETQATFVCEGTVLIGTLVQDDKSHEEMGRIYAEVHGVLRDIFRGFRDEIDAAKYDEFKALVETDVGGTFGIGGITFGDPMAPYDAGNANMIGIGFNIHFSL